MCAACILCRVRGWLDLGWLLTAIHKLWILQVWSPVLHALCMGHVGNRLITLVPMTMWLRILLLKRCSVLSSPLSPIHLFFMRGNAQPGNAMNNVRPYL